MLPRLFEDRYSGALARFQAGYGPRMSHNPLEVPPPDGGNLIFDWNPAVDPYADTVSGTELELDGTGSIGPGIGGLPSLVCDGNGSLIGRSCPVASLGAVSGLSFYFVCSKSVAAAASEQLGGFVLQDQTSFNLGLCEVGIIGTTNSCNVANYASGTGRSNAVVGAFDLDQVNVLHGHFSTVDIDAAYNATGIGAVGHAATDPSFDGVVIGATQLFAASGTFPRYAGVAWVGNIYRVLVYATKTYNADVVDGL